MQRYPVGTKQYFIVDVTDRLDAVTTLDGYAFTFDVKEKATGTNKISAHSGNNDGMLIECLIDTTGWDLGVYQLWVTIIASPESPRLGPFEFRLVD